MDKGPIGIPSSVYAKVYELDGFNPEMRPIDPSDSRQADGFDDNAAVIINKEGNPRGTGKTWNPAP